MSDLAAIKQMIRIIRWRVIDGFFALASALADGQSPIVVEMQLLLPEQLRQLLQELREESAERTFVRFDSVIDPELAQLPQRDAAFDIERNRWAVKTRH